MFKNHYIDWQAKRIAAITNYYGAEFFKGKSILELGCGFGDIGASFHALGASITCSDARQGHLDKAKSRYPFVNIIQADLDKEWPFGFYDVIFHMGTLYHLNNFENNLVKSCKSCTHLVLETEVCDSSDPTYVLKFQEDNGYDQAYNGMGCRPSPSYIERLLKKYMLYELVKDDRCNSGFHVYDWDTTNLNSEIYKMGLRRFWFCKKLNFVIPYKEL